MANIGERLKELRKEKNIKQGKLCEILNISQGTYSGYETNAHKPDIDTLIKIANYYKVSLDYLTGRYDK